MSDFLNAAACLGLVFLLSGGLFWCSPSWWTDR